MTDPRFAFLQQLMEENKVLAIALNPGPTLTYLTGLHFHLMERPTVLLYQTGFEPVLILPELEVGKVASSRLKITPVPYNDNVATWQEAFNQAVKKLDLDGLTIAVESTRLRFLELDFLQKAVPSAKFISGDPIIGNLRIHKEDKEVSEMHRAVKIAQDALITILPMVKAGISEQDIAAELTIELLRKGSDPEFPFTPIIASGPNSANPHAVPTDRKLQNGDLVVIDWGARSNGYCSDLTRTFAIGELSPEIRKVYETVKSANAAGRSAGRPGIQAGDVDRAARNVIEKAGYGQYFTHRTGHGLGMEDHETPYIFDGNSFPLAAGMTYTVEPGIYLPGIGGVRIEDDMVVTNTGSESLSDISRDLIIL